jgi:hypothetical protein
MYGAGILLEFFMAVGASAAVALLFSWQQGQPAGESGGTDRSGTPEGTLSETTGEVPALESTVRGTPASPTGAAPRKPTDETSFVHCAKDENSRGDYIYIDDLRIDGEPDAVVIVSPTRYQGRTETNADVHNISVWERARGQKIGDPQPESRACAARGNLRCFRTAGVRALRDQTSEEANAFGALYRHLVGWFGTQSS